MPRRRQHAQQHVQVRTHERRQRVAVEAARLIAQGAAHDFQQAKLKAAHKLGILDDASLPRNLEIESALREYQRLFQSESQSSSLLALRQVALQALEFFRAFDPRLVGPVLEGTADAGTPVSLQLHVEDADAVPRFLEEAGIPLEARTRRVRLDREREEPCPVWTFGAGGAVCELTVLPLAALRQAPLSCYDDKPARRASLPQLRHLLAGLA